VTQAAKALRTAVNALADNAEPLDSALLTPAGLRRLRIGEARVLYQIDDQSRAIHILTIGRVHR
jgi:mRNA-degrading endonuclease RelE of RelBE toxin-antitoxin system